VDDSDIFHSMDPNGFFVGEVNGEIVGTCRMIKYSANFGYLGLFIVDPAHQGKGYGTLLFSKALKYVERCATVGVDSVSGKEDFYRKAGFRGHFSLMRFCGINSIGMTPHKMDFPSTDNLNILESREIVNLLDISPKMLTEYDASVFVWDRRKFLSKLLSCPYVVSRGIVVTNSSSSNPSRSSSVSTDSPSSIDLTAEPSSSDECSVCTEKTSWCLQCDRSTVRMTGFGIVRPFSCGNFCVGPLFADSLEDANNLFLELIGHVPLGASFYMDVPSCNPAAVALAEAYHMKCISSRVRMYTNGCPSWDAPDRTRRVFASTKYKVG